MQGEQKRDVLRARVFAAYRRRHLQRRGLELRWLKDRYRFEVEGMRLDEKPRLP